MGPRDLSEVAQASDSGSDRSARAGLGPAIEENETSGGGHPWRSVRAGAALLAQRGGGGGGQAQPPPLNLPADTPRITALKTEAAAEVEKLKDFSQQMVDQIFSYGELGFQESETSKYLVERPQEERLHGRRRASPAFRPRSWRRGATASR